MFKRFFAKTFLNCCVLIFVAICLMVFRGNFFVFADSNDNVSGFAWSPNIGWISFNNSNNLGGSIDYGVNIKKDGDLEGFAWAQHVGFISFNRKDTDNPPLAPFNSGGGAIAKYDSASGKVTGWMRVLAACQDSNWSIAASKCTSSAAGDRAGGWDGWIRFCDDALCGAATAVKVDAVTGDWSGYAWAGRTEQGGMGWISLSGLSSAGAPYSVRYDGGEPKNDPPGKPTNLDSDAQADTQKYCFNPPSAVKLSWKFNDTPGDIQTAYQMILTKKATGEICDTGKIMNDLSVVIGAALNCPAGFITYDSSQTGYDWQVKVWDSKDAESSWSDLSNFKTPSHEYPNAVISSSKSNFSVKDEITISNNPGVSGVNWEWKWSINSSFENISGWDNESVVKIKLLEAGQDYKIDLIVSDRDNPAIYCQGSKIFKYGPLPGWMEIGPNQ